MAGDPETRCLMAAFLEAAAEWFPPEQWALLFSQGLLRDEPGDREEILKLLEKGWDPDSPDPSAAAGRVVAAARAASLLLDAAEESDPGAETARNRIEDLERRKKSRNSRFRDLLDAEWAKVDSRSENVEWSYVLTPALPSEWPPAPDGRLYFYAGAYGDDRRHPDASHSSPVWARVETIRDGSSEPRVVRYSSEVVPSSRPGIFLPRFTKGELLARNLGAVMWEAFEAMLSTPGLPNEQTIVTRCLRDYYLLWFEQTRQQDVGKHHQGFHDWLSSADSGVGRASHS